jgi:hypothetical protein
MEFVFVVYDYSKHYPSFFYLRDGLSETGFCVSLEMESTPLGVIDRASLS